MFEPGEEKNMRETGAFRSVARFGLARESPAHGDSCLHRRASPAPVERAQLPGSRVRVPSLFHWCEVGVVGVADDGVTTLSDDRGRHATNLELFLDLVFVFAVTQIAGVLASDLAPEGFGHGLLLAWLVWWLWSQFAWLGTALDLGGRSTAQYLVLATVPLTLLMAVAIPDAFGASGLQFAGAYLAVNLWALGIQGWSLWREPATRAAWLRYLPLAAAAPCVLLVGGLLEGEARFVVWSAVAVFNIASAIAGGRVGATGPPSGPSIRVTSRSGTPCSSSSRSARSWSPWGLPPRPGTSAWRSGRA
jgi:Bacterial low temperature requirement A protein (LtrA)